MAVTSMSVMNFLLVLDATSQKLLMTLLCVLAFIANNNGDRIFGCWNVLAHSSQQMREILITDHTQQQREPHDSKRESTEKAQEEQHQKPKQQHGQQHGLLAYVLHFALNLFVFPAAFLLCDRNPRFYMFLFGILPMFSVPVQPHVLHIFRRFVFVRNVFVVGALFFDFWNRYGIHEAAIISVCAFLVAFGISKQSASLLRLVTLQQKLNAQLREANEVKGHMISTASHELRSPCFSIGATLELMLQDESLRAEHKEQLRTMRHSVRLLLSLVNDVLALGKIEKEMQASRPMHTIQEHWTTVSSCVNSVSEIATSYAQPLEVQVDVDVEEDLSKQESEGLQLSMDSTKVQQIVLNLMTNAIKISSKGDRVNLRVSAERSLQQEEATLVFSIRDHGRGIPHDVLKHLFKPFAVANEQGSIRSVTSLSVGRSSTGLGLSIAHDLVHLMGGAIIVQTTTEATAHGTEFIVKLPFKIRKVKSIPQDKQPSSPLPAAEKRPTKEPEKPSQRSDLNTVIVAEDNPINMKLILALLKKGGITADTAADGAELLRRVRRRLDDHGKEQRYRLIITDQNMPNCTGMDAARQIRDMYGELSAGIVLSTADVTMMSKARHQGQKGPLIDHVLTKPFTGKDLCSTVHKLLQATAADAAVT